MSRLGSFQFDGLAREKQVDVVVRTQSPLHRKMREDIRAIYVDTLTALDFSGTIGFRVTQEMESEAVEAAIGPRRDLTV